MTDDAVTALAGYLDRHAPDRVTLPSSAELELAAVAELAGGAQVEATGLDEVMELWRDERLLERVRWPL